MEGGRRTEICVYGFLLRRTSSFLRSVGRGYKILGAGRQWLRPWGSAQDDWRTGVETGVSPRFMLLV